VYSEVAQMIIKVLGSHDHVYRLALPGWLGLVRRGTWITGACRSSTSTTWASMAVEYGFWPMLFGGFFLYTAYYGTDQTQAQRILAARDEHTVRHLLLFNGLLAVSNYAGVLYRRG